MRCDRPSRDTQEPRPAAMASQPRFGPAWWPALMGILVACAPMQTIEVRMEPRPVTLFVDGEPSEAVAEGEIRLRADRSHILHFERTGYRPQQRLVESREEDGEARLRPERISIRLEPIELRGPKLEVELETVGGAESQ